MIRFTTNGTYLLANKLFDWDEPFSNNFGKIVIGHVGYSYSFCNGCCERLKKKWP